MQNTRKRKLSSRNGKSQKKRKQDVSEENMEGGDDGSAGQGEEVEEKAYKEMRKLANGLLLKRDEGQRISLSELFTQKDTLPLSLQEELPFLSRSLPSSFLGNGVWEVFRLWLECRTTFAQHQFVRCFSASLAAINLLCEKGCSPEDKTGGKERLGESLQGLFLVRKKTLLAHFQSLSLISSYHSQERDQTTTLTENLSSSLNVLPSPLSSSSSPSNWKKNRSFLGSIFGWGSGGVCPLADFEMGLNILHLLLVFVSSLPTLNHSQQNHQQDEEGDDFLITDFEKREMFVLLLKKLQEYCKWFFCCVCRCSDVPPYLSSQPIVNFSVKTMSELLRICASLLSFSTKALLRDVSRRRGEETRGGGLVGRVVKVLRTLGVVLFEEGEGVRGLVVVKESVEVSKVVGMRMDYVQGVVLRCVLELQLAEGGTEGKTLGALEREDISRESLFTHCLDTLEEIEEEDWVASLVIGYIRLRRLDWSGAQIIFEQAWNILELEATNFSDSPYNLGAFNLASLRWFVQSMRGVCKRMMGHYSSALKLMTSSLQNASSFDVGGHLLSMYNLAVIYKLCGENEAATSILCSYDKIRQANGVISSRSCFLSPKDSHVIEPASTNTPSPPTPSPPPQFLFSLSPSPILAIWDIGLNGVVQYELGSSYLAQDNPTQAVQQFECFMKLMHSASSGIKLSSSSSSSSSGFSANSKTYHLVDECVFLKQMCYALLQLGDYVRCSQLCLGSLSFTEDSTLLVYLSDACYHIGQQEATALSHLRTALSLVQCKTNKQQQHGSGKKRELWFSTPEMAQAAANILNNQALLLVRLGHLSGGFDCLKMAVSCSVTPNEAIYYNFCALLCRDNRTEDAATVWLRFRGLDLSKQNLDYFEKEYNAASEKLRKVGVEKKGFSLKKSAFALDCSLLSIWAHRLLNSDSRLKSVSIQKT